MHASLILSSERSKSMTSYLLNQKNQGFTILELLMVMVIAAILLGVAVPSYTYFNENSRLKNTALLLYSTVILARSEAIKRNASVTITPDSSDWIDGWKILDGVTTLRDQHAMTNILIKGPSSAITFDNEGRVSGSPTFLVTIDGSNTHMRCITIGLNGNPRIKIDKDGDGACNDG